jgi:hypothetical protein
VVQQDRGDRGDPLLAGGGDQVGGGVAGVEVVLGGLEVTLGQVLLDGAVAFTSGTVASVVVTSVIRFCGVAVVLNAIAFGRSRVRQAADDEERDLW